MSEFKEKYGPWALITGASSGIGEAFAGQVAARGINTVLVARRKDRLEKVAKEISQAYGVETRTVVCDLSTDDFIDGLAASVKDLEIGLLVSNAGIPITGQFLENDIRKELGAVNLTCKTTLILTHLFGNLMRKRKQGGIIIMSSVTSYYANPGTTTYAANKAFTRLFSGGIWHEFKKHGIDVLSIIPGLVKTELFENSSVTMESGIARYLYLPMKPETVVSQALDGLGRKAQVLPGLQNKLLALVLGKLIPTPYDIFISEKILRFWEWETRRYRKKHG